MRPHRSLPLCAAALALALSSLSFADTVVLKSGEKVEGKILSETPADITVEVKISAGIADTRTIARSEVEKIEKTAEDEQAFQAIKNLAPGPNALPPASYDAILKNLQAFLQKYPQSAHADAVAKQAAAFEEEKKRVEGGETKLNGRWLTKEEVQKEQYQIRAQLLFNQMQEQARAGNFPAAMNVFDQIEKSFPGARIFPDAVAAAKNIVVSMKAAADRALPLMKANHAEREKGVQLLSEPQRSQTQGAIKAEQQRADAAFDAAVRANLRWPPMQSHEKTLTTLSTKAVEEAKRLASLPVDKMRQSLQLTDQAREQLGKNDIAAADTSVREALAAWSANEQATRLQTEVSAARTAAGMPAPAAPTSEPTDAFGAPVIAFTERAPANATPAPAAATSPASSAPDAAASNEIVVEDGGTNFFFLAVVGVIGLIIVLAAVNAFRRIRRRASEIVE